MQKDTIDHLFENLKGKFDVNEPQSNHEFRFLEKLEANQVVVGTSQKSYTFRWKPFIAIAASIVLCLSVFISLNNENVALDLASVSPELSETQDFFTATIENELKKLNIERSPLTEQIITDALEQIKVLENNYQNLKTDLTESTNDQRVIFAMITNFQNRIDILNTVLEQIQIIKELKTTNYETSL
ncbi:MAG: hypothetical protein NWP87_05900 [Winogradskyella sp.]|nr:hypothetical protein [Winogradskyella sp.]